MLFLAVRLIRAWAIEADSRTPLRASAMVAHHLAMVAAAGIVVWHMV
ncbi:MAG TPA: hypothetical protein VK146_02415 [Tabrizicola sp.]|nr:hypothetical protein [Tabrizicola sp.]